MAIRDGIRKFYLWARFAPKEVLLDIQDHFAHGSEWREELRAVREIKELGWYESDHSIENFVQPQFGTNFLGFPAIGGSRQDGKPVGWFFNEPYTGQVAGLPSYQATTDLEINIPRLIDRYQPSVIVEFGTASGASAVLLERLMRKYTDAPVIASVDIVDIRRSDYWETHETLGSESRINFITGDAISHEVQSEIRGLLQRDREGVALVTFDDDHSASHVMAELITYAPCLRTGDVIVVQDTWDQGLRRWRFSALLAVLRFLKSNPEFELDEAFLRTVLLPCNFVHGVLVRKST